MTVKFGATELEPRQEEALRRAKRIEIATIAFLVCAISAVYLVMGNSQAMKAAWLEDCLSLAPPVAFLIAVRLVRRAPSARFPYGYHRAIGISHLVAGVALLTMGFFLIYDSLTGLLRAEHPPIGSVHIAGNTVWLGWLMIGVMALTIPLPIYFGRVKMKLAEELHDKVLFADADMNKADWMTAVGSIVGVAGIGLGVWWLDSAAALFIAASILSDGIKNVRHAIVDLIDSRATTFDNKSPHPLTVDVAQHLCSLEWVQSAACRVRDEGHVFHVEAFVVPIDRVAISVADLEAARDSCRELDWKIHDVVIVPVSELPPELFDLLERGAPGGESGREEHQSRGER